MKIKRLVALILAGIIAGTAVFPASATGIVPYDSYTYDYWENIVLTPAPYVPGRSVTGVSLGIGAFVRPQDMSVGSDGTVYIADTGNNRIVVANPEMTRAIGIIDRFEGEDGQTDSFNSPNGITICPNNFLYVADMLNRRVVALDMNNVGVLAPTPVSEVQTPAAVDDADDTDDTDDTDNTDSIDDTDDIDNIDSIGDDDPETTVVYEDSNVTVIRENDEVIVLVDADTVNDITDEEEEEEYVAPPITDEIPDDGITRLDVGRVARVISDPQSEMLEEGFLFTPQRVAVDFAGRVYVIAQGMFQGIMVFNQEGDFTGFFGTINVQITTWEIIWRTISTRAQRQVRRLFIPTEFTGVDVDDSGFIYASNIDIEGEQAVRRLNPNGEDVIRTGDNENLGGDLEYMPIEVGRQFSGPSEMVDVVYRGKGIYSLLDRNRGRIFTYDREGNLLYIFGGMGSQAGTFRQPVAIEAFGSTIMVLDANRNEIMTFEETLYGQLINEAVGLRFDGDESLAVEKWRQVLKLNENLEIANIGIGKAYLTAGDNESAMHYLRLGQSRTYYSIAYRRYRNEILKDNLPWILTTIVGLAIAIPAFVVIRRFRRELRGG